MKYFKQYGEQRTGTNYLKNLVEKNFEDTTVFASVLGWKHGMYETSVSDNPKFACGGHKEWVDEKTKDDGRVYSVDNLKLPFERAELLHACEHLNYLIMIKDIYGFVFSFKNFRRPKKSWEDIAEKGWVKDWCLRYIKNYRRWLELYKKNEANSIIIHYEDLVSDMNTVLEKVESKFHLKRRKERLIDQSRVVRASTDAGLLFNKTKFDKTFYSEKKYMEELPRCVIDEIDEVTASEDYKDLKDRYFSHRN